CLARHTSATNAMERALGEDIGKMVVKKGASKRTMALQEPTIEPQYFWSRRGESNPYRLHCSGAPFRCVPLDQGRITLRQFKYILLLRQFRCIPFSERILLAVLLPDRRMRNCGSTASPRTLATSKTHQNEEKKLPHACEASLHGASHQRVFVD